MESMEFTVTVSGGLLGWEHKEILERILGDVGISQRKSDEKYFYCINEVKTNLNFTDIDELSNWFKVEWYSDFNLELEV